MAFRVRRLVVSLPLILLLLGGGAYIAEWLYSTKPPADRSAEPRRPPVVDVRRIELEDIQEVFVGYGSARAARAVTLAAEVGGMVVDLAPQLDDGSRIVEGQLLARIDDRTYRRQLDRAESMAAELDARISQLDVERGNLERMAAIADQEVRVNREELKRLTDLFEEEQASKKEVDFAHLAYQRSRRGYLEYANQLALIDPRRVALTATRDVRLAEARLAELDIERCQIVSPFDGQIERLALQAGDRVQPGSEIARIVASRHIEIPIELPASVRPRIAVGARCRLAVESMPGIRWEGTVSRLSPGADPRSRTFSAYVMVDNDAQDVRLIPGYFVTARVMGPILRQVLAVPRGAIVQNHVFVVNAEAAHLRTVKIERFVGERAVVSGDLRPNDVVILSNLDALYDGAPVKIAEPPAVADGKP